MQDCVIGCFSGYGWDEVKIWARSLAACGFAGRRVVLMRDAAPATLEALVAEGCEVVDFSAFPPATSPYVERFSQLRRYLNFRRREGHVFRWVVATDMRDVCFQRDPVAFLARLDPPRLVLAQEGMTYAHATWNADSLAVAFGAEALEAMREAAPNNVGVLAGPHRGIEGLAHLIQFLARAAFHEVSDQAALNLLADSLSGALLAHVSGSAEAWACQAGVMADPTRIVRNRPFLLGPEPAWRDGTVVTAAGEPYAIVHQYDRVPEWQAAFARRYGG